LPPNKKSAEKVAPPDLSPLTSSLSKAKRYGTASMSELKPVAIEKAEEEYLILADQSSKASPTHKLSVKGAPNIVVND